MQRRFQIDYDYEQDSLFLYREKSHGSVEIGNLILDFSKKKELVGIEILRASRFLQGINVSEKRFTKTFLKSITDCKIEMRQEGGFLFLKMLFSFREHEPILMPLQVPSIKESSPLAAEA